LLVVEFTSLSVELADPRRKIGSTFVEIHEVNTPLLRFGLIAPERLRLYTELVIGTGNVELFKIGTAVEELFVIRDAVVFDPDIRTFKRSGSRRTCAFQSPVRKSKS